MEREPIIRRAANSNAEYISCTECTWGVAVVATGTLGTDREIRRIFNEHHCEEFPRCHVQGCMKRATYGFRETQEVGTSGISEFIMISSLNWCLDHDAEMRTRYAGKTGNFVGPL